MTERKIGKRPTFHERFFSVYINIIFQQHNKISLSFFIVNLGKLKTLDEVSPFIFAFSLNRSLFLFLLDFLSDLVDRPLFQHLLNNFLLFLLLFNQLILVNSLDLSYFYLQIFLRLLQLTNNVLFLFVNDLYLVFIVIAFMLICVLDPLQLR